MLTLYTNSKEAISFFPQITINDASYPTNDNHTRGFKVTVTVNRNTNVIYERYCNVGVASNLEGSIKALEITVDDIAKALAIEETAYGCEIESAIATVLVYSENPNVCYKKEYIIYY